MGVVFFGMGVTHLVLFGCMFLKSDKVKIINEGMWIIKILVGLAFSFLFWLISGTAVFGVMSYVSVWIANWFYVFVALVFVDLVFALDATFE